MEIKRIAVRECGLNGIISIYSKHTVLRVFARLKIGANFAGKKEYAQQRGSIGDHLLLRHPRSAAKSTASGTRDNGMELL